jgi:hypothetical protein
VVAGFVCCERGLSGSNSEVTNVSCAHCTAEGIIPLVSERGTPLNIYEVVSWGASVGVGASGARHLHLASYGKTVEPNQPYVVVNELVAAEIGHFLRLPIPPCCIVADASGKQYFASLSFALTGNALPPIIPVDFYAAFPEGSAALLAFDVYIANYDRHAANLAAEYGNPQRFNVFDHSHCLLNGTPPAGGEARLRQVENALVIDGATGGNRHCLIDRITDDRLFGPILQKIESIPDFFIETAVDMVGGYGISPAERASLTEFLLRRRNSVRQLIATNHAAFPSMAQWSLL